MTATIANITFKDSEGSEGGTHYGQLIGLGGGGAQGSSSSSASSSIVTLSFPRDAQTSSISAEDQIMDPGIIDTAIEMKFFEMRFLYMHQYWLEIFDYIFEGFLGTLFGGAAAPAAPVPPKNAQAHQVFHEDGSAGHSFARILSVAAAH